MIIKKFEEQVEKNFDRSALVTNLGTLTYGELNRSANRAAHEIKRIDKQSGETRDKNIAALLFEHSADMIIGVIAALKADKIYVPLDINYPGSRLTYMLENSGAFMLLTNSINLPLAEKLAAGIKNKKDLNDVKILNIDTLDSTISTENIEREPAADKLAYILYTSGSTGKPKGVVQNLENVDYYIGNWTRRFSITSSDRLTLFSAFSHDGAGQDIFGALLNGAVLYPYNILNRANIGDLARWLIEEKITIWHSVPTLFRYFVNTLKKEDRLDFPELRFVLLGGEQIRDHDIQVFRDFFPAAALANVYGQTESSVDSIWLLNPGDPFEKILVGEPLDKTKILLVDKKDEIVEDIGVGEIVVSCEHIALGYWRDPQNSEKVFTRDPELGNLYFTGDQGRLLGDGSIEFMGRKDSQVKIRGFRVEIGEIETRLLNHKAVKEVVVTARDDEDHMVHLYAYVVPHISDSKTGETFNFTISDMREHLARELPEHMIPSYLVQLKELPLTPNGKIDRKKLPLPENLRPQLGVTYVVPRGDIEIKISRLWQEVLNLDKVGLDDNFFDLGGTSFDILKIMRRLYEEFQRDVPVVAIFRYPTIRTFVEYLNQEKGEPIKSKRKRKIRPPAPQIAVIGMAGRFPGGENIVNFWENLKNGVESISFFTTEELERRGVNPQLLQNSDYVRAKGILKDIEYFDAPFFNYSPAEAEMMDPQLRILHECCLEALEDAGYDADSYDGLIGLYAGNAPNQYWVALTYLNRKNSIDIGFLNNNYSTKVSYKLNLTGPSFIVQTACSTSLVSIHLACRGLIDDECDIALAGGVSISLPDKEGYLYQEGMLLSPDGHCRAFDAEAGGTIFGNGVGIVALKRLEDAVADGDTITAVIRGSAINNDGNRKVGISAPSVDGQAEVIRAAQELAEVEPESITYVETHGTGTILGDPVEIEALKLAFNTGKKSYCAIGSVKTNVGHLNSAAGVAGFIKTVLSIKHKIIPPSINFQIPNPKIDFEDSPFYVNTRIKEWKSNGSPLRAGVSSFGIGGTNAHVVLEEWPVAQGAGSTAQGVRDSQLILLSAKNPSALERMTQNLADHFKQNPGINLADAAYTLQVGRKAFKYRQMLVCSNLEEAVESLLSRQLHRAVAEEDNPPVIFMFSGQGAQYVNMGQGLYQTESLFREEMDHCFEILEPIIGYDLKDILYPQNLPPHNSPPGKGGLDEGETGVGLSPLERSTSKGRGVSKSDINQTEVAQPLLFALEYSMAKLLISWGITPHAMVGHSIGEYVAACLSGVFSLEDALKLVALRGKLMQKMSKGTMLSVPLPEEEITPLLHDGISLAAVNSSSQCVVSGSSEVIEAFQQQLNKKGFETSRLHTSHAFHSAMMDPILPQFQQAAGEVNFNPPLVPYISNVTGQWITTAEAADPGYWTRHLRSTVRFSSGLMELLKEDKAVFLEVGPGQGLSTFVRQHADKKPGQRVINLIRHPKDQAADTGYLLNKIAHLWLNGQVIDGNAFYSQEKRQRIPLPSYSFEKQRYWLEKVSFKMDKDQLAAVSQAAASPAGQKANIAEWFYTPTWKPSTLTNDLTHDMQDQPTANWLVIVSGGSQADQLLQRLKQVHPGDRFTIVKPGTGFKSLENSGYTINPGTEDDYLTLFMELQSQDKFPHKILHLWNIPGDEEYNREGAAAGAEPFAWLEKSLDLGYYSLLNLARAIHSTGKENLQESGSDDEIEIIVLTDRMQAVTGEEVPDAQQATIRGAVQVISREYAEINCRTIDIDTREPTSLYEAFLEKLPAEIASGNSHQDMHVAYRDKQRWVLDFTQTLLENKNQPIPLLKEKGVYLVTGGLGGIGLVLAEHLAETLKARLILTGRSEFPEPQQWEDWLVGHDPADPISCKIRKIRQLQALGAEVLVLSADVANLELMNRAVSQAQERFGRINGIIHSAGIPGGGLVRRRTKELSEEVFASKIKGTLVLEEIFRGRELDFFILCSSISSVLAPVGQVAYCAANAFLDAYAHYKTKISAGDRVTISINWDNWQEVGMAAKAAGLDLPVTGQTQKVNHPLLESREIYGPHRERFISYLQVNRHWVLEEHRIMQKAVFPGTAYLELAFTAAETSKGSGNIQLEEVYFLAPLVVEEEETKEVHTLLREESNGYTLSVVSSLNPAGDQWVEHARAMATCLGETEPQRYEIADIEKACQDREIIYKPGDFISRSGNMTFGPRWNGLKWAKFGKGQALALLELPGAYTDDTGCYKLHPALVDVATTFLHSAREDRGAYLPFYYKKIKKYAPLPAKVYCYTRAVAAENNNHSQQSPKEILRFDITLMNEQGIPLVEVEEFTLRKINVNIGAAEPVQEEQNYSLVISKPGDFDSFTQRPTPRKKPGPGEIEIAVRAAGLNFKEVLMAMGGLDSIDPDFAFGLECSGTVTACGEGVEDFTVGDPVIAFGSSCFNPYVITSTSLVAHKPSHLSFEEAATIPVAFLTAYYALVQLGQLKKGERVLIHSAAGGVGQAAVKIAQWKEAEIFATAGNKEKRSYLRSLGIRHIMDSRNLDFAAEVMKRTDGKGVHVVLNSLAGEFIGKSISLLAPYGRFIEIGMRDLLNNYSLGLRPFLKGLSYFSLFLDSDLPGIADIWHELVRHFENKTFTPLPRQAFPIDRVAEAFEFMTRGKHIGKIVVARTASENVNPHHQPHDRVAQPYNFFFSPASKVDSRETLPGKTQAGALQDGILPGEGIDVFKRILSKGTLPQVVVSTTNLAGRIQKSRGLGDTWFNQELFHETDVGPLHDRPEISAPFVPPKTETEQIVANIWQELLGLKQVGVLDDFFELGGDSLKAVRLVSRIRSELEMDIPVFTMFDHQTIRAFTQYIAKEKSNQDPATIEDNQALLLDKSSRKMKQSIQRLKNRN